MTIGASLRREMLVSSRRRGTYFARSWVAAWSAAALIGPAIACDLLGWDRASPAGSRSFALATFGLVAALQLVWVLALAPVLDGPSIAAQRDRKTLDSLLASRFSSADVVLGMIGVGLLRSGRVLMASAPPIAPLVGWGGGSTSA